MLWSSLLTLYRSLTRHRLYSAINILGLAVGIAVFMVLWIAVSFELGYDRWIPNHERTYRVGGVMDMPGRPQTTIGVIPGPVLPNLKADFSQIEAGARLISQSFAVRRGEQISYEDVAFVDSSFFDVFDIPVVAGQRNLALRDNNSIAVSEAIAKKYFGSSDRAVGGRLTVTADGTPRDYQVTAVLKDLPDATHLKLGLLARLDKSVLPQTAEYIDVWNATNYATYIRVTDTAAARSLDAAMPAFMKRRGSDVQDWLGLKLERLDTLHFNTNEIGYFKPGVERRFVTMLQVIGILTLVLAIINYVNLSTARAAMRAREVALRKVFGASRGALIVQFLVESVAVSLVAGLIGLALVELSLPLVDAALGSTLRLEYLGPDGVIPMFFAIVVAVGLMAGLYPAIVISRFQPAAVLAASRAPGGGRLASLVREGLVLLQFAATTTLFIGAAVVVAQAEFVRHANPGFQRDGLIIVQGLFDPALDARKLAIRDTLQRVPGVVSTTISGRWPGQGGTGQSGGFHRAGLKAESAHLALEPIGDRYFETMGIRLVAGRNYDPAMRMDDMGGKEREEIRQSGLNVIINEKAVRELEFAKPSDAIGQTIRGGSSKSLPLRIVGVVGDARYGSARDGTPALVYLRDTSSKAEIGGYPAVIVRYRGDSTVMMNRLLAAWNTVASDMPFKAKTSEAALDTFYKPDEQRGRLITAGAVVAGLIGCLGLYGLASFSSQRRTREVGVRKVLGASTADIFRLLIGQFLRPVLLANLVAWPLAWYAANAWLDNFDQRIDLSPVYFITATALSMLVAALTVTGQALKVASADPGKALRDE